MKRVLLAAWIVVTQLFEQYAVDARRSSDAATAFIGGAIAAGLGLGVIAVVVLSLWITSPYPDNGLDGALHVAADCWLLAHGTDLLRMETLSGEPAPVGVTPLLLTVLPVWLLHRAGADSAAERAPLGWAVAGYLAVGGGAVLYTSYGPLRSDALSASLHVPVVAAAGIALGAWTERGDRDRPGRRRTRWLPFASGEGVDVLRAAAGGTAVLVGGGAVLAAGSLLWHAMLTGPSAGSGPGIPPPPLAAGLSGQLAVLLTAVLLAPDAAVWGAAYALGPGFSAGAGVSVAPGGVGGHPVLPNFPLLAALPGHGPGAPLAWAVLALPVAAGAAVGWPAATARPGRSAGRTALVAGCAAMVCGAALAVLAGLAAGPLGTGALARFGPTWWLTGAAAAAWSGVIGVPVALAFRLIRRAAPPER
jgi:hypothetical protein